MLPLEQIEQEHPDIERFCGIDTDEATRELVKLLSKKQVAEIYEKLFAPGVGPGALVGISTSLFKPRPDRRKVQAILRSHSRHGNITVLGVKRSLSLCDA